MDVIIIKSPTEDEVVDLANVSDEDAAFFIANHVRVTLEDLGTGFKLVANTGKLYVPITAPGDMTCDAAMTELRYAVEEALAHEGGRP